MSESFIGKRAYAENCYDGYMRYISITNF